MDPDLQGSRSIRLQLYLLSTRASREMRVHAVCTIPVGLTPWPRAESHFPRQQAADSRAGLGTGWAPHPGYRHRRRP